ncbi:MAG: DUF1573 domain-containing protein [Bacteroidales bacterium]|nr:DUF1573 domain-containing protein [Bacteroidales bacterium]
MRIQIVKIFAFIGFVILTNMNIYAQNSFENDKTKTQADEMMINGSYYQAAQLYKSLLDIDSNQIDLAYKYALCNHYLLNYQRARYCLQKVKTLDSKGEYPEAAFYLGLAKKNLGYYSEAISDFEFFLTIGKNSSLLAQAKNEITSCTFANRYKNDSANIVIEHLLAPINTEYSEFNPVPLNSSELVFSRYQNVFKDTFESIFSQSYISDIMISKTSERGVSTPSIYSKRLQSNYDFVANICFNHNFRKSYFTICEDLNGSVGNCAIYYSEYKNGKWKKAKRLNNKINTPDYSSTQPFLARANGFDILYFSSNKPGGFGAMDLWYVIIKDDKFQEVTNLGSIINTKGSEITPNYDSKNQILYFSSDWHQGFGGLDIFSTSGGLNSWTTPKNLGLPINSTSNDNYYYSKPESNEAWLSSNRIGSFYHGDAENCCNDIYYVNLEPIEKPLFIDSISTDSTKLDSIEEKIQKLLPLTLYFHNDIPNPRSTSSTTNKNYQDLLNNYFKLKEKYKKEYSKGLKGDKAKQAIDDVNNFFENYVGHGFEDLEKLAALLKSELEKGKDIRLKIRGYASPLNTSDYNLNLSKRRIASLINYLKSYDNGYFLPYFANRAKNGGSITIFEDPLGDSQSADFVSDNPNDKRNSVYSRAAAMERKIQIILYSSGNTIDNDLSNKEFPIFKIKTTSLSPDSIKQGQRGVYRLEFTNVGKAELEIKSITSNSPFVSTQLKQNSYQPGENGTIYLLVQTENLSKGSYSFELTIKTNMINQSALYKYQFIVY